MNSNEIPPQKGGWLTHFARWLFSRRGLRAILILLVWVVTLVFLVYAFENWRGKKAWNQVRADLEKRGEVWQFDDIVPKPVFAEQNFASLPLVTNWFDPLQRTNSTDDKHPLAIARTKLGKPKRDPDRLDPMVLTDLIAWARALELGTNTATLDSAPDIPPTSPEENTPEARARAAGVVLAALAVDEASLAQVRDALRRPYSRYPVNFETPDPWSILLPHLAKVKMWAQRLTLKASAELDLGRTDAALQDVQTVLGLENSLRDEPFLISYLVRVAILKIAVQPVWEGIQDHRWNEEQLKSLVERFSKYDLVPALQPCLATERAAAIKTLELVRRHGELVGSVADAGPVGVTLARLLPSGWYYCEMANYSRIMDWLLWEGLDLKNKRVHPDVLSRNQQSFQSSRRSPVRILLRHELAAGLFLPALTQVARRATQAQAIADFAALACALEHYRLRNGQFPESLAALVPASIPELPKDWITGAPYQYRKTDASFLLYSVGWDQKDELGNTSFTKGGEHQGDWVWGYAFP